MIELLKIFNSKNTYNANGAREKCDSNKAKERACFRQEFAMSDTNVRVA